MRSWSAENGCGGWWLVGAFSFHPNVQDVFGFLFGGEALRFADIVFCYEYAIESAAVMA